MRLQRAGAPQYTPTSKKGYPPHGGGLTSPLRVARLERMDNPRILIESLFDDVVLPSRATAGSAGHDLRAYLRERTVSFSDGVRQIARQTTEENGEWGITLLPGEMALVPLGFRTRLPGGMEAQVRPRSGQAFRHALTIPNAPGTVDADYAEEWLVIVRNDAPAARRIVHGERIAQVVFARFEGPEFDEGSVTRSTERTGGFGSTGKH